MEIGSVSEKIKRGRHTTRHSELIYVDENTYVMDTPGFSSLYIHEIEKEELKDYFNEFNDYEDHCRFVGCMHLNEPGCAVKEALKEGIISGIRYDNYKALYKELKDIKSINIRYIIYWKSATGGYINDKTSTIYPGSRL